MSWITKWWLGQLKTMYIGKFIGPVCVCVDLCPYTQMLTTQNTLLVNLDDLFYQQILSNFTLIVLWLVTVHK